MGEVGSGHDWGKSKLGIEYKSAIWFNVSVRVVINFSCLL